MEQLSITKKNTAVGTINLPGSKSVSNRALLLASLASGKTTLTNLLVSDDTRHMLNALKALGVEYTLSDNNTTCTIQGMGGAFKSDTALELFLGNAGTAMRPLTAALCLSNVECVLTGEPRMFERPIKHLVDALREFGADVEYLKNDGYPPLKIKGKTIDGGGAHIDGSVSSQYITAFLMSAPLAKNETILKIKGDLVSKPYIDITLKMMKDFGVEVINNNYQEFIIPANSAYKSPKSYLVEGDASGASYFLAAGAIAGKVKVTGIGKNSMQGDVKFTKVLEAMGANVVIGDDYIECSKGDLHGVDLDLNAIPDAAMTVVPLAIFAKGKTVIRNVANWRVKETDRLSAMANELKKLGIACIEGEDYLEITPSLPKSNVAIDTYNDHRMAMCFSLVSFIVDVIINDPKCVNKTFPEYFKLFDSITK